MTTPPPRRFDWRHLLLAVLAALAAGITFGVTTTDDGHGHRTIVIHAGQGAAAIPAATLVDGPDADHKADDPLPLNAAAAAELGRLGASSAGDAAHGDLRGQDPSKAGVLTGPLAAQEWPGCRTAFARNFSSRNGTRPSIIVWHQTVSHENGLSSQNALTARANDRVAQVSWHFLIGRSDGLCTYTVPTQYKAWHGANANPFTVGIEVEAAGDEPSYVAGAGKAKLFAVTRRIARLYGIPLRHGLVRNCQPVRSGIVEHHDLGVCGGGHVDVCSSSSCHTGGPESAERPAWRIDPLIRELAAGARSSYLTTRERGDVAHLAAARRATRRAGGWAKASSSTRARQTRRRELVQRDVAAVRAAAKRKGGLGARHRRQRVAELNRALGSAFAK